MGTQVARVEECFVDKGGTNKKWISILGRVHMDFAAAWLLLLLRAFYLVSCSDGEDLGKLSFCGSLVVGTCFISFHSHDTNWKI